MFIGTLKDNIQHDIRHWEHDSLENAFRLARKMRSKIMATRKPTTDNYKDGSVVAPSLRQPIRFTPQQLEEKREKGLCYSCDSNYTKGHKCAKKKLFYIDCEEEEEKEQEMLKEEDIHQKQTLDNKDMDPTISCNALAGITTPQTIRIEGHIKKKKVIVLIDSRSTHNFIHFKIAKKLNCFLYPAPKCQVMVASGRTINFSGKCHNLKLSMGEYVMNSPMLSIPMGGANVVPRVQWLQSLDTIAFNFQELFMKFSTNGKEVELRGIAGKPGKIINSNRSIPLNIRLYIYPYAQKSETECMVVEMLEAGIIQPSQSSFFALVVLVHKKDGSWCMCLNYRKINKLTIKDKFPIPVIDELHGSIYFTKLDLCSRYHKIKMKIEDIPKIAFRTHEGHYEFLVMPFGLTNAPSTFQGCYNYWRRNNYMEKAPNVSLGHIVSHEGAKVDPTKIKAIKEWKIPTSIKHLRGFLVLTGNYRKFAKNYGRIAAPLTTLLNKDAFSWTPEAIDGFEHLKEAMCQAPILATLDFTETFIVECDASRNGIGVVLMQDERPTAFEIRPIKGNYLQKTIYEKEMLAILHALRKW
eukprot:PITA_29460